MEEEHKKRVLITGGLGFIGSHFVQLLLSKGYHVINVDKKTYAARKDIDFFGLPNYEFIEKDICELTSLPPNLAFVVNFAAESHVENSIHSNFEFFHSNVQGVYNLLERIHAVPEEVRPTLIQISTDEVYGDILTGYFSENDRLKPSSPYSATKAAADQLVLGWIRTYGIKARICRSCNNYGFGQHGEKLIPKTIKATFRGEKMTVHGTGLYTREWIHVEDNCAAIFLIMERGADSEIYNISTNISLNNLDIIKLIHSIMRAPADHYTFVENRQGQDVRYAVTSDKIRSLGWSPKWTLETYLPIFIKQCEERTAHFIKTNTIKNRILKKVLPSIRIKE